MNLAVAVVDMQSDFLADISNYGARKLIGSQIAVIKRCRTENIPLLYFELLGCGITHFNLQEEFAGLKRFHGPKIRTPTISSIDGIIEDRLDAWGIDTLYLMGMNRSLCVFELAREARGLNKRIMLSEDVTADVPAVEPRHKEIAMGWYSKFASYERTYQDAFNNILPKKH